MLFKRLLALPRELSLFLVGPRGCGKITCLRQAFPDALFLDLLESANVVRFQARPDSLEQIVLERGAKTVVIDEIQRVPDLLPTIHRLIRMTRRKPFRSGEG
jgi:predicted AAA+ superfamily ATPase